MDNTESLEEINDTVTEEITVEQWLAIRKEAALQIDPESAEVTWEFAQTSDPYGVKPDLPEEHRQVGRVYFARSPGTDIWVWFGDLPDSTLNRFWERHETSLPFPAGVEGLFDL